MSCKKRRYGHPVKYKPTLKPTLEIKLNLNPLQKQKKNKNRTLREQTSLSFFTNYFPFLPEKDLDRESQNAFLIPPPVTGPLAQTGHIPRGRRFGRSPAGTSTQHNICIPQQRGMFCNRHA